MGFDPAMMDTVSNVQFWLGVLRGYKTISFVPPPGYSANDVVNVLRANGIKTTALMSHNDGSFDLEVNKRELAYQVIGRL